MTIQIDDGLHDEHTCSYVRHTPADMLALMAFE